MSDRLRHKPPISEALLAHLPTLEGWLGIEHRLRTIRYWNVGNLTGLEEGMGHLGFGVEADIESGLLRRLAEAELDQSAPAILCLPGRPNFAKKAESRFFDYFVDAAEIAQADPANAQVRPLRLWIHAIIVSMHNSYQSAPSVAILDALKRHYDFSADADLYSFPYPMRSPVPFDPDFPPFIANAEWPVQAVRWFMDTKDGEATTFALDWLARAILASMQEFCRSGQSSDPDMSLAMIGNFPDEPVVTSVLAYRRMLKVVAHERDEWASNRVRWQREREAEEHAQAQEVEDRAESRLSRVGEDFRDGIQAGSISWGSMTPKLMSELVFSHPTTTLAVMCGVSDVAIAKYCKKHSVEKPPRGYWQKRGRFKPNPSGV